MTRTTPWTAAALVLGGLLGGEPAAADPPAPGTPGASLGIASLPNLRDIGGYKTRDGRAVRTGLLYRSGQLAKVRPADREAVAALGLKAAYDLRTPPERKAAPDELPEGVREVPLDLLADSKEDLAGRVSKLLKDPKQATAELGDGKLEALFTTMYREFVTLPSARKALGRVYADLAKGDLPAAVHCSSGRDRTGWAAAALLTLLGVPDEAVVQDFLRSNDLLLPAYKRPIEAFAKAGGDPAVLTAVVTVKPEYLTAALAEVKAKYGSIEGYFSKGLGVDASGQKALKDRFLARE